MQKISIVTGLTGMDGSLLSEKLLAKGHKVYGIIRRSSRGLDLGCASPLENNLNLEVVEGDVTDPHSMNHLFKLARADYCYGMASQSHVGSSFTQPIYTAQATGLSALNCLEAIRNSGIHTRYLNAATSELFGGLSTRKYNEQAPFHPRSPYGCAKLYAYWITVNFRESYKIFACNSIAFNHEGPRRGPNFVTRKISLAVANIKAGKQKKLYLGNLDAKRDWSDASDVCDGLIMQLEHSEPSEFVFGSGETHSIRDFLKIAFTHAGLGDYSQYVEIDPKFYRPCEVDVLTADYSKARRVLGWEPKTSFEELVKLMVDHDLKSIKDN